MRTPRSIQPSRGGGWRRPLLLTAVLSLLPVLAPDARAQITITEINPTQSSLDANNPNGASGGRVNGLARAAGSSQVFFAASEWGGLYKSLDAGATWSRLDGHLPAVIWDVETSPADANRVLATSFYDGRATSLAGINLSTDGGAKWSHPASAKPPVGFCLAGRRDEPSGFGIAFDPASPQKVYVGTNCGLAISGDGGQTWNYRDPTPADPADDVWDVVVHHGGIIDICGDDGHQRSTNGGNAWSTASGLAALPSGRCSIAASPDESGVLFAVAGNNVFESDDGGQSWSPRGSPEANPQGRIPFVATNQRSGSGFNLWFGDITLWRAACTTPASPGPGVRCPSPGSWAASSAGAHADTGDVAFGPPVKIALPNDCLEDCQDAFDLCKEDPEEQDLQCLNVFNQCKAACPPAQFEFADACPLLFSSDGGVYVNTKTTSPGCHAPAWEQPKVTPRSLWLFGMDGAHQANPASEDLYFVNQDTGSYATTNAGAAAPTWFNRECCDGFDASASSARVLYTRCCFVAPPAAPAVRLNQLWLRNPGMTGGAQINTYPAGVLPGWIPIDLVDQFGPDDYVLVTTSGVFITTNITANPIVWTELGAATTPPNACGVQAAGTANNPSFYVQAGSCSGTDADTLWLYTGTTANGAWQQLFPPGNDGGFGIFAVDRNSANRLLASQIGAADTNMIASTDGGTNWTANAILNNRMTGNGAFKYRNQRGPRDFTFVWGYSQPTLVAFDPVNPQILLAGGADSGIFLSTDGGANWGVVTNNSGPPANPHIPRPRFAYFDHEDGKVNIYVGTQGRGVWRLSFPDPAVANPCLAECEADRNACLATPGELASVCLQQYNACKQSCP